jgi:hypothetical protein
MQAQTASLPLLNHYTLLLYPFFHTITDNNRTQRIQSLAQYWEPWWSRLSNDIPQALDDTYFFLPYIRDLIFPETALFKGLPSGKNYVAWARRIAELNRGGLVYLHSQLPSDAVLRITYCKEQLAQIRHIDIFQPYDQSGQPSHSELSTGLEWVDAVLFPSGIGFLILKLALASDAIQLSHLIGLNASLRTIHPPTISYPRAHLRFNNSVNEVYMHDVIDFLLQGIASDEEIVPDLTRFTAPEVAPRRLRYTESELGQAYGERCHILSYACVDLKSLGSDTAGNFKSVEDRIAFEYLYCLPTGLTLEDPTWMPSEAYAERIKKQYEVSMWDCWLGRVSNDAAIFLATKGIDFNLTALPRNIEADYLPLYFYSLHQKYQLLSFSNDLMPKGAYVADHLEEVRTLMDQFVDFRNKYWFNEVTNKPLGSELYNKFQQGLWSLELFELVSTKVKELKEFYESKRQQRIDTLLNVVTFIFLPLTAVIGIFGMTFFDKGTWKMFGCAAVITGVVSAVVWLLFTKAYHTRVR